MTKPVLIAYGTRLGSTHATARIVAGVLADQGVEVNMSLVEEVGTVQPYGAVVIGSSIRSGRVLPEVFAFINRFRTQLLDLPTACFISCMKVTEDTVEAQAEVQRYMDEVRAHIPLSAEAVFPGVLRPEDVPTILGLFARASGVPTGDFRDANEVRVWTQESLLPVVRGPEPDASA